MPARFGFRSTGVSGGRRGTVSSQMRRPASRGSRLAITCTGASRSARSLARLRATSAGTPTSSPSTTGSPRERPLRARPRWRGRRGLAPPLPAGLRGAPPLSALRARETGLLRGRHHTSRTRARASRARVSASRARAHAPAKPIFPRTVLRTASPKARASSRRDGSSGPASTPLTFASSSSYEVGPVSTTSTRGWLSTNR